MSNYEITAVQEGATIIRIGDHVDTTGDEPPVVSKAWASHGEVKIHDNGTLSYLPDETRAARDDITFIVHDSHWSTQVMKIRIENQIPLPELGNQLIPNQFDGMDTHVNLDIGGYLSDLLLDDQVTVSVTGLPPGLTYNASRMHIEGVLNSDGGEGQTYVVYLSITTAAGQVLTTQFRWIIQQERALDAREALTRAVPPIGSQSDAAAAAVLYSVASQATMAARGFSLTPNSSTTQSNGAQAASQLDIARNDLLAGESGKAVLKGSEGQARADLRVGQPTTSEEEGEEAAPQLTDTNSSISLSQSSSEGLSRPTGKSSVDLDQDGTLDVGGTGPGAANEAPFAGNPTSAITDEDTGVTNIDVLAAAYDPDGDALTISGASAANGTVGVNSDGTLDYVPDPDFNGTDTITYTIADGSGNSTGGAVSVIVTPVNDAPSAGTRAAVVTDEDTNLNNINVLSAASDPDGDPMSVTAATASNGVVTVNGDNTLSYTPNADYFGSDTINYTVSDGAGGFDSSSFSVTVNPINDAPRPVADSDVVLEDGAVSINILGNDADIDGSIDSSSVQIVGTAMPGDSLFVPGEGTWSVNTSSGNFTFTPVADFDGAVSDISYTVADTLGARSDPATVSVTITPVNDAPVAAANSETVAEDSSITINVLANDFDIDSSLDPASVRITGTASAGDPLVVAGEGTWSINTSTGEITFTPEADYDGAVTDITYTVRDTAGAVSNATTVSVSITGSNDAPVAGTVPDSGTNEDTTVNNIDVLSFVTDADGDTVSVTGASASNGTVVVNGDGTINYTPDANYNGTDTITFNLDDGNGGISSGSVDVVVAPVNDNPDSGSPPLSNSNEDSALNNIDVLFYASDIDGDSLTLSGASAANGVVTINPDGTLNYTPSADFNGLDTISYTVDDGNGGTTPGSKFVYVNPVNDPPVADDESAAVLEDGSVTVNVLTNDVDIDGSLVPSTVQITGTASPGDALVVAGEGTWSVNSTTGEITFVPETNYTGAVAPITYTVEDNSGAVSDPATVSMFITSVNDAPILDLSDTDNVIVNGNFSDGTSPNWVGWFESGSFDSGGSGANAPAVTNHDTNGLASVTQTGLSGLSTGPSSNGAALVSFDFGWSDHNHESESIQVTLTVAGTDYAQITTTSGPGTTASVVYLNGATGPATVINSSPEYSWIYENVQVNLPASVSDTGDITLSWLNLNPTGDHTDEASIDNVKVFVADSNPSDTDNQITYTAGDPPVQLLDISSSISDLDGTSLQSSQIVLTNAETGDQLLVNGSLAGNGSSGTVNGLAWSSSISGVTVTINISGAATHADYLTALSMIEFENTASSPTASARAIDITVNDGIDDSSIAQAFILLGVDASPPSPVDDTVNGFEDTPLVIDVLANDAAGGATIDPTTVQIQDTSNPGDPLIVVGEGTWSINPTTGEITFTGEPEFSGVPTPISYSVSDISGFRSALADVNVTIIAVNDAPVGSNDSDTLLEDGAVTIDVLANDSDVDGTLDPTTVQITGTSNPGDPLVVPGQGTWSVNTTSGEITFTPEPDYAGSVTDITYTVQDDGGATSNATTVSVSITPVNDAPVATNDSDVVLEDGSVVIDVLANDNDVDGTLVASTLQIVGTASAGDSLVVAGEGTWSVNGTTGEITFTPESNYNGPVADISYTVEDNNGVVSNAATVSVSITATNDVPVIDLSDYDNAASNSSFSAGSVGSWVDWVAVGPFSNGGVSPNAPAVNNDTVGSISTLTQTGVTGLADGPGSNGTAIVEFDLGWNDTNDGGPPQKLSMSVDGVVYARLTTPDGLGPTASVSYLNGASGPATTIEVNLPASVPNTADIQFEWENLAGVSGVTDDISIDNVKVIVNDSNPNDSDYEVDYQNGNAPISLLDSSVSISDTDGTTLQSAQVLLTFAESGDAFHVGGVPATNGASGTVGGLAWSSTISGGQIEVNLSGTGSHATYLAALQQIQFDSNSATPVSSTRVVDITVNDGTDDSVAAQTFILFDINDAPPNSSDDSGIGWEDIPLVIDVLANDTSGDFPIDPTTVHIRGTTNPGDPLVVAGEGTWSVNGTNGEITFTPVAEFSGTPTPIEYTVSDTSGLGSKLALVSATIAAVNDAPVGSNDSGIVTEDGAVVIDVLANDSDIDGTLVPSTVQITGTTNPGDSLVVPGEGTWSVNTTSGEITFTPEADYSGSVTDITYTVDDNGGATSSPASVSVSITPVNDAPNAANDSDVVNEDSSVVIDVLANDSDVDGTLVPSTVQIVGTSNPGDPLVVAGQGTWTVNTVSGAITFTPEADYTGAVSDITYTVADNSGATSSPATVSVTITNVNDAPTAANDSDTVLEDGTVAIDVLANDTDLDGTLVPASVQIVGTAAPGNPLIVGGEGTWTVNSTSGEISFTPEADYTGPVSSISYTVNDDSGATSNAATISIAITPVNDAPTANGDSDSTAEDGSVTIDVLANDSDIDGTLVASTVQIVGTINPGDPLVVAGQGTWTVNTTNGEITFTPEADYAGAVSSISYTVDDNNGATSNAANIAMFITAVNDPPTTVDDSDTVLEDGAVVIDVLANNTDVDGTIVASTVQIVGTTNPGDPLTVVGEGQWSVNSTSGEITFTPEADYTGSVTDISYTVRDNSGALSSPASVSVSITPVNDPPTLDLDLGTGGNDSAAAFSEGAPSAAITSPNTAPYDVEDSFYSVTVTLDAVPDGADEFLIVNSPTFALNSDNAGSTTLGSGLQVAYTYTAATRELVLTNLTGPGDPLTAANVEEMLETLSYRNSSEDPTIGDRTFTIVLEDTSGSTSAPANAVVTVYAVNDAPVAVGNGGTVTEDSTVAVAVLANDSDVDGTLNPATIQIVGTASAGDSLVVAGEGTWSVDTILGQISFTPEADYDGPVADITYTVRDNLGEISNAATVTMSITPANDAPTAITPAGNTGTSINTDGGNAAYFMASDGGALLGGLSTVTVEAQFSLEAPLVDGESAPLFNYHAGSSDQLELTFVVDIGTSATPFIALEIAGSQVNITSWDASEMMDGGQHTLAMTWDNTGGDWELFLDGGSVASGSGLATSQTIAGGGYLVFGQEQDSPDGGYLSSEVFKGTYHDVRVFDDIRSPAELTAGVNATLPSATSNMIANWLFDDGETTAVTDVVGGNDLSLTQVVGAGFTSSTPSDVVAITEDSIAGTVVANLSTVDIDTGDTFTYALTSDPSGIFEIVGGELRIASGQSVDYEAADSHTVSVEVTDSGGATFSRDISIKVLNVEGDLVGTSGNDLLQGTPNIDALAGLAGNDYIYGQDSDDSLLGGDGNDQLYGQDGSDKIDAGDGDDTLYGDRDIQLADTVESEVQINTTTTGDQSGPVSVALADGNVLVVWYGAAMQTDDSGMTVFGQIVQPDGTKVGTEFSIGTSIVEGDNSLDLSPLYATRMADGNVMVGWVADESLNADSDDMAAVGAIVNVSSQSAGSEFIINTTSTSNQSAPILTALDDGRVLAVWHDEAKDGSPSTAYLRGQILNDDGTKSGSEFQIGTTGAYLETNADQPPIDVVKLADGNVYVGWMTEDSANLDGNDAATVGSLINTTTATAGTQMVINQATTGDQSPPKLVAMSDGSVFAMWYDDADNNNDSDMVLYGRFINDDGTANGSAFSIGSSYVEGHDDFLMPMLDAVELADGNIMVNWLANDDQDLDGDGTAVIGAVIDSGLQSAGTQFVINSTGSGLQSNAALELLHDGRVFAVWYDSGQSDSSSSFIRGQFLNADGSKDGLEFTVSTIPVEGNTNIDLPPLSTTVTMNGDIFVSWQTNDSENHDGDGTAVISALIRTATTGGDDELYGGLGNDILSGGAGNDYADGGISATDIDTYIANGASTDFNLVDNLDSTFTLTDTRGGSPQGTDTLTNIEAIQYTDQMDAVGLTFTGNGSSETIVGTSANDTLDGAGGGDTIDGGYGDDTIYGDSGDDIITGGAGDDTITSGSGTGDIMVYSGNRADYIVHDQGSGVYTVTDTRSGSPDGTDTLITSGDPGDLQFADQTVGVDSVVTVTSPIAFDLNRDGEINVTGETTAKDKSGIESIGETVQFDMDGDDDLKTIEWLDGTGDALLVDNRDGNAADDMNGTRLFGDQGGTYDHGYQQLAELDSNADGVISGDEGDGLNLWVDDGNAKVDEGELFTLQELGISEIEFQLEEQSVDDDGRDLFRSSATLDDGTKILTEDVWFAQDISEDDEQIGKPDLSSAVQQDDLTA